MFSLHYYDAPAYAQDILPRLWSKFQTEELPPWFWGGGRPMSLTEFVVYFSMPGRHLFLAFFVPVPGPIEIELCCGMLWLDECVLGQHARAHLYFFREFQRRRDLKLSDICQEMIDRLADPPFSLKALYFFTDTRATMLMNFAKRLGVTYLATLPHYYPDASALVGYLPLVKELS